MIKLKNILKEAFNRGAIVIDNKGKLHNVDFHGNIIYKFDFLMDNVISMGFSPNELRIAIESGTSDINKIIDSFGFIRCGIWSSSKRQLYVNWFKPTSQAKNGLIKYISKYKPTEIYVEDMKNSKFDGMYTVDEFIEEYL